jgi:DNA polymerase III epsilon subunit-like protein
MKNKICIFDFETDGSDPLTCSPVQIAAVMIDPYNLEIIKESEFNIQVKPDKLEDNPSFDYSDSDILDFHSKVRGCESKDILKSWQESMPQQQAWTMFKNYLQLYHINRTKKNMFSAPIASGYNIFRFDLKIVDRYAKKFGYVTKDNEVDLFYPRDVVDIMNLVYYWFENNSDIKSLSLDNMRSYFGISKDGAHDALKDVKDCADILIRFFKLHRKLSQQVKFKNSFLTPLTIE